ncbi:LysR family transcriptional regulator [Achromobacter aloeverae]
MNLTPRQLKLFVLLADNLNFQRTADKLFITQPTLSKLVKELEATIGVKLFDRTTRRVSLTRDGQDLLDTGRQMLDDYESGMHRLDEMVRERTQRAAIAALPTLAATLLPALVMWLAERQPRAAITVYDLVADEALALLRSRRVDMALTAMYLLPPDLHYSEMFSEPFVLLHAAGMRVRAREWDTSAIGRLPLISMPAGTSTREAMEARFAKDGLPFEPVYSLRDLNTIARFAQAGCGIGLLPLSAAEPFLSKALAITRPHGAPQRSIGIFTRKDARQPPLVSTLMRQLQVLGRARMGRAKGARG